LIALLLQGQFIFLHTFQTLGMKSPKSTQRIGFYTPKTALTNA
jgi:hypothetical protein